MLGFEHTIYWSSVSSHYHWTSAPVLIPISYHPLFLKWVNSALFFVYFRLFHTTQFNKSIDVVLGTQTWGGRMEGAEESSEPWWHPISHWYSSSIFLSIYCWLRSLLRSSLCLSLHLEPVWWNQFGMLLCRSSQHIKSIFLTIKTHIHFDVTER